MAPFTYCVSNYPSNINDFNLNNILILKKKFNLNIDFSDHSIDDFVGVFSNRKSAEIIEKHITFDDKSIDADFSKKHELKDYIANLKKIKLLNNKNKYATKGQ